MSEFLTKNEQQNGIPGLQHHFAAPYPFQADEAYMNASQRQHFENILHAWKETIQKKLMDMKQQLQAENMPETALEDRAFIESELSAELPLQNYYQQLIAKIETAMQNIADREYGFCENCDQAIGVRRLEAIPIATTCITCQQLKEKQRQR